MSDNYSAILEELLSSPAYADFFRNRVLNLGTTSEGRALLAQAMAVAERHGDEDQPPPVRPATVAPPPPISTPAVRRVLPNKGFQRSAVLRK